MIAVQPFLMGTLTISARFQSGLPLTCAREIIGPGYRIPLPHPIFELLDLPLFDSVMLSEVPHNTRCDAIALRDYSLAEEQPYLLAESFSVRR